MEGTKDEIPTQTTTNHNNAAQQEMATTSLVVFMGLPASGKSTLANNLLQFSEKWKTILISFDDFIPLIVQKNASEQEIDEDPTKGECFSLSQAKIMRKKFVNCVNAIVKYVNERETTVLRNGNGEKLGDCLQYLQESLSLSGSVDLITDQCFVSKTKQLLKSYCSSFFSESEEINLKTVVIVDDNNYYKSMRNDFYQVAKLNEIGFCIIYCKTPLALCVQRNAQRAAELQVPHKALVQMSLKIEEPNPMQNPFDMYCIEVNCGNCDSEANLPLINGVVDSSFNNSLKKNYDRQEEIEREQKICSENEVHQADLLLRKWISKKLTLSSFTAGGKSATGNFKKSLNKELSSRKKATLDKLRSGQLKISYEVHQDVEFHNEIVKMFENVKIE